MKFIKDENNNDKKVLNDENSIEELLYKATVTGPGTLPKIKTHCILTEFQSHEDTLVLKSMAACHSV